MTHNYAIQKITIDDVASYKSPTFLLPKKVNYIYGLNGTGKTTISRFLSKYFDNHSDYAACKIEPALSANSYEILVYNQDFIKEHFKEKNELKGIFTLDKTNAIAETAIETASKEIEILNKQLEPLTSNSTQLKTDQSKEEEAFYEKLYTTKRKCDTLTSLKKCLIGNAGTKKAFAEKVLSYKYSEKVDNIDAQLDQLNDQYAELDQEDAVDKIIANLLSLDHALIEDSPILSEAITSSTDGYLTELINKLSHFDWVSEGINLYIDHTDNCPFCNRHMGDELKSKIKAQIDEAYKTKVSELADLATSYSNKANALQESLSASKKIRTLTSNSNLIAKCDQLVNLLNANKSLLNSKLKETSKVVSLVSTTEIVNEINTILIDYNTEATKFNQQLKAKKTSLDAIQEQLWISIRNYHDSDITKYSAKATNAQVQLNQIEESIKHIQSTIISHERIISENTNKTKNINHSVMKINERMIGVGFSGFRIEPYSPEQEKSHYYYRLVREGEDNLDFESLSEGEKTFITFMYFLELCQGQTDNDSLPKKRIIVIDDPISSLSFDLVYDIGILIKDNVISANYEQIFILTHHLYFLHELLGVPSTGLNKHHALFRLVKYGSSQILEMKKHDIQNNYHCFWQILKDAQTKQVSKVVIPNTMRHILEYYFSFLNKRKELSDKMKELAGKNNNPSFRTFDRYINRSSHLDATNHNDEHEIDLQKFLDCFKLVFEETGHLEHYNEMMGIEPSEHTAQAA